MINKKNSTEVLSIRFDSGDIAFFRHFCQTYVISLNELIKMFVYDSISRYGKDSLYNIELMFEGIDLKKIAEMRRKKILRDTISFERNEIKSKHTFELRVKKDIYRYLFYNLPFKDLKELLEVWYNESMKYIDSNENTELTKKIDRWRKFEESQFKELRAEIVNTLPLIPLEKKLPFDVKK